MLNSVLYIIIPVHNRRAITLDCLTSLFKQTYKNFKVIVIDDGSTDGTAAMIAEQFPQVIVLKGDGTLWWSRATNIGIEKALEEGAVHIMTLNDDTITPPDFLENMMRWAVKHPRALIGAAWCDAETKLPFYAGERIRWMTASMTYVLDVLKPDERHGLHPVTHFPGRGLLIPAEVFRHIGFFDADRFPQLAADYDFTHRAYRANYKIYCNLDAVLWVYPMASGDAYNRANRSLKNFYSHLFGFKGGANLKRFTIYAIRNCPPRWLIIFLPLGILRRVLGYFLVKPAQWERRTNNDI